MPVIVRALRPKQWVKNLVVFAAPAAAGVLGERDVLTRVAAATIAFCFAASASYLLNDIADREIDQRHPVKSKRPIASGALDVRVAMAIAVTLLVVGFGIAALIRPAVAGVLAAYVGLTFAYSFALKHEEVLDIMIIASGFLLRAEAGALAADVPVSSWFLTVMMFGALLMATGKRTAELRRIRGMPDDGRRVLASYSERYLEHVQIISVTGGLIGYALWAFERHSQLPGDYTWLFDVSVLPFAGALLRYLRLIDTGATEAPEDAIFSDRVLLGLGLTWAALFLAAVWLLP